MVLVVVVVLCLQPLKSYRLVEAGVPDWAAEFIQRVDLANMLDLADAASYLRINMCVPWGGPC